MQNINKLHFISRCTEFIGCFWHHLNRLISSICHLQIFNIFYWKMQMIHIHNPKIQEADAGGLWLWGYPGVHNEILSLKKKASVTILLKHTYPISHLHDFCSLIQITSCLDYDKILLIGCISLLLLRNKFYKYDWQLKTEQMSWMGFPGLESGSGLNSTLLSGPSL